MVVRSANYNLARFLGLTDLHKAFSYHGNVIGVTGTNCHGKRIGICSGGAGEFAAEARRLGLEVIIPNCSGWSSSGGPWIAPENSMKIVVASETDVTAGATAAKLPQPMTNCGFYRDIAVFALPLETPVFRALESSDQAGRREVRGAL